MSVSIILRSIGFAALFSALSFPTAMAGQCPTGKSGDNVTPPGPSAPKGVKDEVISSIDLGKGYDIPGRQLRMRRLEISPGGIVPWHSHAVRPANIYIIKGRVTEYRSNCAVPIEHKQGDVVAEQGAISHWWRNNSRGVVVLISADILPPEVSPDASM